MWGNCSENFNGFDGNIEGDVTTPQFGNQSNGIWRGNLFSCRSVDCERRSSPFQQLTQKLFILNTDALWSFYPCNQCTRRGRNRISSFIPVKRTTGEFTVFIPSCHGAQPLASSPMFHSVADRALIQLFHLSLSHTVTLFTFSLFNFRFIYLISILSLI